LSLGPGTTRAAPQGEQATREPLYLEPSPALTPALVDRCFRRWHAQVDSVDEAEVLPLLRPGERLQIRCREATKRPRLIPEEGAPVVVRWGVASTWPAVLKSQGP
jgi:hypothetical protein